MLDGHGRTIVLASEADGREIPTPFSPDVVWYPTPSAGLLAGATDRYRFEILHADGPRIIVERHVELTPVDADEREWRRRLNVATWRSRIEGFAWDGAEMPRHKWAYSSLMPAISGETWVARDIGSERLTDCTEDPLEQYAGEMSVEPCFRSLYTVDVFGADGRYLGEVETPREQRPYGMYIDGNTVVGYTEDEAGIIRVKRYRLVLPDEKER